MNSNFSQASAAIPNAHIAFEKTLTKNGRGEALDPMRSVEYRINAFKADLEAIRDDGEQNGIPFPDDQRSAAYQAALAPILDMAVELANFTNKNPAGGFSPTTVSFHDSITPFSPDDTEWRIIDAFHSYVAALRADDQLDYDRHPLPLAINHSLRERPESEESVLLRVTDILSDHGVFLNKEASYAPKSSVSNDDARASKAQLDQEIMAVRT